MKPLTLTDASAGLVLGSSASYVQPINEKGKATLYFSDPFLPSIGSKKWIWLDAICDKQRLLHRLPASTTITRGIGSDTL